MKIKIKSNSHIDSATFDLQDPILAPYLALLAKKSFILLDCKHNKELLILRGHIAIEFFLNEIIKITNPRGGEYLVDNFTFYKKVEYIKKLKVVQLDVLSFAGGLNKIRNNCAHKLEYRISDEDVDVLGSFFPNEYAKIRKSDTNETLFNMLTSVLINLIHDAYPLIKKGGHVFDRTRGNNKKVKSKTKGK